MDTIISAALMGFAAGLMAQRFLDRLLWEKNSRHP